MYALNLKNIVLLTHARTHIRNVTGREREEGEKERRQNLKSLVVVLFERVSCLWWFCSRKKKICFQRDWGVGVGWRDLGVDLTGYFNILHCHYMNMNQ